MKTITGILIIICCMTACNKPPQDDLSVGVSIPNAFRPHNKDGINTNVPCIDGTPNCNQYFKAVVSNPNNIPLSVSMAIYDKKGRTLFSTTDPNTGWDGTENNQGKDYCEQGNYHYQLKVTEVSNHKSCLFEGDIALLR